LTLRHDGVGVLDVHAAIETPEGVLIDLSYQGFGDFGADGHAKFLRGELPSTLALRTAPRIRTTSFGLVAEPIVSGHTAPVGSRSERESGMMRRDMAIARYQLAFA
jgi:hypothetical protein